MRDPVEKKSVAFFEAQFQRQAQQNEHTLNPFEAAALEHLRGTVLDLGAGLGNLSLEAGRRGHRVVAVDASPTAVARIQADARREGLPVQAIQADLESWSIDPDYDTIVAIGLLMFFPRKTAHRLLREIKEHVRPGGRAIVNVLIEGTTYLEMFDPNAYHLFGRRELEDHFAGWTLLSSQHHTFPAPDQKLKEFSTVIAQKPEQTP